MSDETPKGSSGQSDEPEDGNKGQVKRTILNLKKEVQAKLLSPKAEPKLLTSKQQDDKKFIPPFPVLYSSDKIKRMGPADRCGRYETYGFDISYFPDMDTAVRENMTSLLQFVGQIRDTGVRGISAFVLSRPDIVTRFMKYLYSAIEYHRFMNRRMNPDIDDYMGFDGLQYKEFTCSVQMGTSHGILILTSIEALNRTSQNVNYEFIKLSMFPTACRGRLKFD